MRLLAISLAAVLALAGCALLPQAPTQRPDDEPEQSESVDFAAPDSFGDWTTTLAWAVAIDEERDTDQAEKNEALQRAERDVDEQLLSDSYGADAIVEAYQRDDYQQTTLLRMVAAEGSGYFVPASESDTTYLKTKSPRTEVQRFGDVECLVVHPQVMQEESEDNVYSECMMRSEALTIWLGPVAVLPEDLAELTEEIWDDVDGGTPTTSSTPSIDELELPETIGDYVASASVLPDWSERFDTYTELDLEALATAYNADAAVGFYRSTDLNSSFDLYLVDTKVVEPFIHYVDPERIGMVAPTIERVEIDDAVCLVSNLGVREGGSRDDLESQVQWCYLTDGDRTAFAMHVTGDASDDNELIPALLASLL